MRSLCLQRRLAPFKEQKSWLVFTLDRFLEVTASGVSLILHLLCSSVAGGRSSICGKSACDRTKQERAAGIDGKVAVAEADSRAQGAMLGRSKTVSR